MADINLKVVQKPAGQKRIGICVPMRGHVECNFMASFINIMLHYLQKPNVLPLPIFSESMPIDAARNELSKQAILAQCDYLLWLDSDVVIFPEQLDHMWNLLHTPEPDGTERQIVSGIYFARAPPYYPVLRKFHKFHRYFEPDNIMLEPIISFDEENPFTVDGAGMGCVLMKRLPHDLVFNATKGQPFQTIPNKVSEDLFFFGKLREGVLDHQGKEHFFKVWVDPFATCAHLGASVTLWHHKHSEADRYIDIGELSEYMHEKPADTFRKCIDAPNGISQAWLKQFGVSNSHYGNIPQQEIDEFYKNIDYRYDLTFKWFDVAKTREKILAKMTFPEDASLNVLDFGCGIGDYGLNTAERYRKSKVIFFDINKLSIEYLKHRLAARLQEGMIAKDQAFVIEDKEALYGALKDAKFDAVFALDVFEHLKPALAEEYARWLYDHMQPNGILLANIAPLHATQPQHISAPKLEDYGFVKLDDDAYCRSDSLIVQKIKEWQDKASLPEKK